jgi:hypothetical protein
MQLVQCITKGRLRPTTGGSFPGRSAFRWRNSFDSKAVDAVEVAKMGEYAVSLLHVELNGG